jgi:glycosyltransferase involved in cell wall biosynthesis
MRILQVIHGYPPRYNAGSEIYTQTISRELVRRGHDVRVFTREEAQFLPDYSMRDEVDPTEPRVRLSIINMPRSREAYRHEEVDNRFDDVTTEFDPDVVHIGHLNHLSTSIIHRAKRRGLPVVFTLHDFWLMCPRGQFVQYNLGGPEPWAACDGQEDRKCAEICYSRYFGGGAENRNTDVAYWTEWVHQRMSHVREVADRVDMFVSPSRTVGDRLTLDFGVPRERIACLDYGFDRDRLAGRSRKPESQIVFGYIGTHRPAKGIHILLDAFTLVSGNPLLRIWGRVVPDTTPSLKVHSENLHGDAPGRVQWMGEYGTQTIVNDVFDRIDALVVPSIWMENSPLVIHEAQQARVPVITSNMGGMAEYVHHEENGLLFRARDPLALAAQMQRLVDDPSLGRRLGERGYLYAPDGDIPSVEDHVDSLLSVYRGVSNHDG